MILHIRTKEELNKVLAEHENVVLDFYADWCNPCQMLGKVIERVSKELENITFVKVNVDNAQDLASEFGVFSIPDVFFFKNGVKAGSDMLGARSYEDFVKLLSEVFSK